MSRRREQTETESQRLEYLERRVEAQQHDIHEVIASVRHLDEKVDRRIDGLNQKIDQFRTELSGRIDGLDQKLDRRIDALDQKVDKLGLHLSGRIDGLDQKVDKLHVHLSGRIDGLDEKVDRFRTELSGGIGALDRKMTSQFKWLVGIMITLWTGSAMTFLGALLMR